MPKPENEGVLSPPNVPEVVTPAPVPENASTGLQSPAMGTSEADINGKIKVSGTPDKITVEIQREKPSLGSQILTWALTAIGALFAGVGATCGGGKIVEKFSTYNQDGVMVTQSPDRWIILALLIAFVGIVLGAAVFIFWIASRLWKDASAQANAIDLEKVKRGEP